MKYHYVYRITNIKLNKYYYGCRTSNVEPKFDIGINYFSSSTDKEFKQDQKENYQNYKYKVVKIFNTRKDAEIFETKLHKMFEVQINESFYNKAQNTLMGFSIIGRKQSKEHINKRFKNITGKTYDEIYGKEKAEKIKENQRKPKTEEMKQKISLSKQGIKLSKEHKESISKGLEKRYKNKEFYSEFCKTMKEVNNRKDKREKAGLKLKEKWKDPEYLEKMRKRNEKSTIGEKLICPHCSKTGGKGPMKRWHFDNCKMKDINEN